MRPVALIGLVGAALLLGCGDDQSASAAKANRFDAGRAMRLVHLQVDVGQRPAGSPQLRALARRLRDRLPRGRLEAVRGHPGLQNVVGSLPGRGKAIVVGAHYDTEVSPAGFVGANDGAAGPAVVIEVARALAKLRRPASAPPIRFVLFDGEEEPQPTTDFYRDALRGSKHDAARHGKRTRAMFLLDYVGNAGLRLPREGSSDIELWSRVRAAARRVGRGSVFPDEVGPTLLDDHTPYLRAGVPAVDLIDWDYAHKDTVQDTPDKLRVASLDAVGETVVEVLRAWRGSL